MFDELIADPGFLEIHERLINWGDFSATGTGGPGRMGRGSEARTVESDEDALAVDGVLCVIKRTEPALFEVVRLLYMGRVITHRMPYWSVATMMTNHKRFANAWRHAEGGGVREAVLAERWHVRALRWIDRLTLPPRKRVRGCEVRTTVE